MQRYTEYLLVKLFKNLIKKNKVKYKNYSGGVAMNVKANMLLSSLKKVNLHVPFAPDDTSQSLGGALALHNQLLSEKKTTIKIKKINSPYQEKNI